MSTNQTDTQMTGVEDRITLPGFGEVVEFLPNWHKHDTEWKRFPHAIADTLASKGVTLRGMVVTQSFEDPG
jgi:hypothetical protein